MENSLRRWDNLSVQEKADIMKVAVQNGITNLSDIKAQYNSFAEGGDTNPYTVGATVDALYSLNPKEEFLGEPSHHYDFTQSEEWANAHGYYPDARGHRDDRVKKASHPSHPSRGTWNGNTFELSDLGIQNSNYTLFGLNDGGQDPQAILTYKGGVVLPEITVTPKENYYFNPYDNIILHQNKYNEGGNIYAGGSYLDIAKSNIRRHEGFLSKPYADGPKGTGWRSVGYGFNDSGFRAKYPGGISRHYENGITKAQAEKELDYILGNMVNDLKRTYGKKWDSFNDNQKAAIIDTYYQRPASVGKKSAFYSAVMTGKDPTPYLGVNGFKNRNSDRKALFSGNAKYTADYDVPSQSSRSEYTDNRRDIQMPEFTPLYPEVFNSPQSNQSQVLPFKGPTVIFKDRSPIEQSAEEYAKYQELAEAKAQEESRQNIMNYLMSSLTPQQQSGDGYLSSIMAMLGSKNTPYGLFAEGGNLYGGGGNLKIGSKPGDRVNVSQCAAWSNKVLQNNGYSIHGDAWSPSNAIPVFSGYNQAARPKSYNRAAVVEYNHQAANNVGRYFNPNKLDKNQPYTVNMYYNGSHYQDQAYRNGKGVAGTHTGILHFDDKKGWVVTHNSGGHIKEDKYSAIANGNGKYGITAIFQPTKGKYNGGGKDIQVVSRGSSAPVQQSQRSVDNSYQQRYNNDFEALPFNPIYPEIFNRDNAAPVLPFNNPIVIEREEPKVPTFDPYSPEVLAAQEKREKADNFMRIMSILGSGSNDPNTSALNAISMLTGNKFAGGGDTNDDDDDEVRHDTFLDGPNGELLRINPIYTKPGNFTMEGESRPARALTIDPETMTGTAAYEDDLDHPFGVKYVDNYLQPLTHYNGDMYVPQNVQNGLISDEVIITPQSSAKIEAAENMSDEEYLNNLPIPEPIEKNPGLRSVYPEFALLTGGRALATGAFRNLVNMATPYLKPGGTFWTNPLTKQTFASELGARGWDAANVALTGNTWAQNLSKDIHKYTGWNPQESVGGQFLMESSNPGYLTPYGMVERGINAATNGARKALDIWNSPLTGRWTTIGNRQYRLSPSSIGADGIPIESRMTSPQIIEANAGPKDIMGSAAEEPLKGKDLSYTYDGVNNSEKQFYYYNRISGKPSGLSGDNIVDNGIEYAANTYKGLPSEIIEEMQRNTSARQIENLIEAGVPEAIAKRYYDKAAQLMKDVRVGKYSEGDYLRAGMDHFGGFYNGPRNFISIKHDYSPFEKRVWKHEPRHLLDDKLDQNLAESLGVEAKTGADFDNDKLYASILQATDNQEKILSAAYGNDFVDLPNTKYAGSLEGYTGMRNERVTTNRDARDIVLGGKVDWEPRFQNQVIDNVSDGKIFSAVESSNGYGRRYIEYLRDNGLLTHEKANQFREAMKKVGAISSPFIVGGTAYGLSAEDE